MKQLTVLVCTHNRSSLLDGLLKSLNAANRPMQWSVDILIVANACTDDTHQLLTTYQDKMAANNWLPLNWVTEPVAGKSHALNSGVKHLTAGLVALVDDDQRVSDNFLVNICRLADNQPETTLFCGKLLPDWDGTEPSWVRDEGPYKVYPPPIPSFELGNSSHYVSTDETMPPGGNLIVRLGVFQRVGNFSTELGPRGHDLGGGEDTAFILKALEQGERLFYSPEIIQYHHVASERLKLGFIMRLAFHRTYAAVRLGPATGGMPAYVWRKLATYLFSFLFSLGVERRRFFLIRTAAVLGEIKGLHEINASVRECGTNKLAGWQSLATYLLLPIVFASLSLFLANPPMGTGFAFSATLAMLCTTALLVKSIRSFTRTGPQLKAEIGHHYLLYSLYALFRLGGWTFALCLYMAMAGIVFYLSIAAATGLPIHLWAIAVSGLTGIATISFLQFCRHLLHIPGSIEASSNYRMSRFYPLWNSLTPGRIEGAFRILLLLFIAAVLTGSLQLFLQGQAGYSTALLSMAMALVFPVLQMRLKKEPVAVRSTRKSGKPNILMIGADSLRADRLGVDGNPRGLTPALDALASRGVYLRQCYAPCARTAPSLVSMLSGLWPQTHGIRDNFANIGESRIGHVSLPRFLRDQGYRTLAISDWCGSDLGKFPFGFEHADLPEDQWNIRYLIRQGPKDLRLFLSLFTHNDFGHAFLPELYYLAGVPMTSELGKRTRSAISQYAREGVPFFINVFMSSTHAPFGSEYPYYTLFTGKDYRGDSKFVMSGLNEPFEVVRKQGYSKDKFDLEQIMNLYDGCVRNFDDEVGKIVDHVRLCGLEDNTIIVVYSDHGMEFFERESWGQGNSVIVDDSARIPLIIADPAGAQGVEISGIARTIDLAPTLLDLSGHSPLPTGFDGVSLAGVIRRKESMPELNAYYETGVWFTKVPGLGDDHLHYPELPELLEVQDKKAATIGLKATMHDLVISAKDRALRDRKWKLVRLALKDGPRWLLYDVENDPECTRDVGSEFPDIVSAMRERGTKLWQEPAG